MVAELIHEHAGLRSQLETIRSAISNEPDAARLAATLHDFAQAADEHFRHEEASGCFERVVARDPRLADRVQNLLGQHPQLRQLVQEIVNLADRSTARPVLSARFSALTATWLAHETQENELLQEAYTQDIGTKD